MGPEPKLDAPGRAELVVLIDQGAAAAGYTVDQRWTLQRIRDQVERRFGVDYSLSGLCRLLHRLGLSVQVPCDKAAERDEAAIASWISERWPAIKA
jgi:putative transposase